jgi:hypothetical protein
MSSTNTKKTISEILIYASIPLAGALFIMSITTFLMLWRISTQKTDIIAATDSGQIIRTEALTKPMVSESKVLSFSDECIRATFSHDFVNFRRTTNEALKCYTTDGAKAMGAALQPILDDLKARRLVMSSSPDTPVLYNGPYILDGRVTWEVRVPVKLMFQGQGNRFPAIDKLAMMQIVRVPLEENARAISTNSIQLKPYTPATN